MSLQSVVLHHNTKFYKNCMKLTKIKFKS
ncbi:UNVERIFIED_CONTAM: hypothetical protein GTU68_014452 [Idotea baltica]|nr:hypothetical protein [Idotea baltica]